MALDRVALHQTRLRVPGIGLDGRGVALGLRGLVLFPSLDRLVMFLAVYSQSQSLEPLLASLSIEELGTELGVHEWSLSFEASSSDRMDRVAQIARLVSAFVFTGTNRHYVQYRDAAAPFGYDIERTLATASEYVLYHDTFCQTYAVLRRVDLKRLLLRLLPQPESARRPLPKLALILAESGLVRAVLGYLTRSNVEASAGISEFPPASSSADVPLKRWLFRVSALPERMRDVFTKTPGLALFEPAGSGVAVEFGFRHPIELGACPVFSADGLVLFRAPSEGPLAIEPLPLFTPIRALAKAELLPEATPLELCARQTELLRLGVPVRLAPGIGLARVVSATLVDSSEFVLLRRLSYLLSADSLATTRVAFTEVGAFLLREAGIEAVPLGQFFRRVHPAIYVPSGLRLVPDVAPEVLFSAYGSPAGKVLFSLSDTRVLAIDERCFVPLESALLEAERWAVIDATVFDSTLSRETPCLWLEPLGMRPLRGARPLP